MTQLELLLVGGLAVEGFIFLLSYRVLRRGYLKQLQAANELIETMDVDNDSPTEGWELITTEVYQNRTTQDVVVVNPETMIFDEEKQAFVYAQNPAKRVYLYDKIEEE
jgi:hypothetical protein